MSQNKPVLLELAGVVGYFISAKRTVTRRGAKPLITLNLRQGQLSLGISKPWPLVLASMGLSGMSVQDHVMSQLALDV